MESIDKAYVVVLFNPKSTGASERNAKRFAKRLERSGFSNKVRLMSTKHAGHAEELVLQFAQKHKTLLVVCSSGDGGYHEVINGALKANQQGLHVVTGLLPSGNANDHYKALHKPYVLKRIKNGDTRKIDALQLTGTIDGKPWERYAHSYIGFGMTSEIGKALNESDLNPAKEILISVKAFVKFQPFKAKVDGKNQLYHSIVVSNVGRMSKFFSLSRKARVDDGLFEIITAEDNKAKLVATLAKSATVGVPHESQTRSFTFEAVDEIPVQLDGEVFTLDPGTKVRITIARHALECIV